LFRQLGVREYWLKLKVKPLNQWFSTFAVPHITIKAQNKTKKENSKVGRDPAVEKHCSLNQGYLV